MLARRRFARRKPGTRPGGGADQVVVGKRIAIAAGEQGDVLQMGVTVADQGIGTRSSGRGRPRWGTGTAERNHITESGDAGMHVLRSRGEGQQLRRIEGVAAPHPAVTGKAVETLDQVDARRNKAQRDRRDRQSEFLRHAGTGTIR